VVASRFLCHIPPAEAEACLRNLARLGTGGGYLFVSDQPNEIRPWGLEDVSEKRKHALCAPSEGVASKAPDVLGRL
jgi:hypothetical protein